MRTCETCGTSLEGRRSTARFCTDLCRANAKRGHRAPVVELVSAEVEASEAAELITLEDVAAVLQASLRSLNTPPSAKASLAREYRATLAEIERRTPKVKDGIDMLAERRAQRGA